MEITITFIIKLISYIYLSFIFFRKLDIEEWNSLLQRDELMRRVVSADNEAPLSLAYTALQITLNVTKFTMPKVGKEKRDIYL